jgi:hypothetical protein
MWAYRVAMLAWALWVSFWLINILKWGWARFSTPELWSKVQWRKPNPKTHQPAHWKPVGRRPGETDPGQEE